MSSDPHYDEQFQPQPPPKKGMSTGTKVLIIILCIFGGFALLCCGGIGYIVYKNRNAVSEDPTVVKDVTSSIAEIDIPSDFEPVRSVSFSLWMKMKVVEYRTKSKTGILTLMEMTVPTADEKEMRRSMKQQGHGGNVRELEIKKTEVKTFKIRGEDVGFTFAEAVDSRSKAAYRQVSGVFPSKDKGFVMLMLQVPESEYKVAEVEKMIQSIK